MTEWIAAESPRATDTRPHRRGRRLLLAACLKNRDGATAVEFALVAMPFFALLFAIIETALVFWSSQVLETAVTDASRLIYTGQFQDANSDPALAPQDIAVNLKQEICNRVVALFDCEGMVEVDVRAFSNGFPSAALPLPIDNEGNFDASDFRYEPSGPNEIVVVRAALQYPVILALMSPSMANLKNGRRLIMASAAFRNEPFAQ